MSGNLGDVLQDPSILEEHAAHLRRLLGALEDVSNGLTTSVRSTQWSGRRADEFREAMRGFDKELESCRIDIADTAKQVAAHADWTERRRKYLSGLQKRIESWAAAYYRMSPEQRAATPIEPNDLGRLPPRYSEQWVHVSMKLIKAGVHW
jgi:hypothetical protein